ncbi:MAG TPA: Calx-beta domain-containing protein [Verrucomicrobiota bacterium]|jgi:hypothetical protein|nr:MAG: Calx-beta domain protein [Verrucomicrobia bacterium ADurb.Bin063]HNW06858.1 Calx-beta domain-containing protein [Verrucomicrobiota bacterium]HNZ75277.1 Calx-beta domain-containing protein [Verrucomicrobiota bacterium]HOC49939.1 Calx-beta domain-containing protein [Verrucomicrobiota bacterium]HOH39566.1 Calx-beta domain-containing protein [Verrucomicrobiota bacterium]
MNTMKPILTRPTLRGWLLALAALALSSLIVHAVPYATEVVKNGNTVSYILNQNAASVEVLRNGGNALYPGTNAGAYNFDMTGYTTFQIKVIGNDAPGWVQYVPDNKDVTGFEYPYGVSVNKNPQSPNFGKVYVSNSRVGTTGLGRSCTTAIYMLHADGSDAGFSDGGVYWTPGGSGPYKSCIGPDDHLYVADLSNDLAYEFSDDMSTATLLIDDSNRTPNQYVHSIYVEGTQAAGNRKLYLVNGNINDTARKGLIQYDLGANAAATAWDTGTQIIGPTYWGIYYSYDVARDSNGDWYMPSYRANPNQRPAITKFDGSQTPPLDNYVLWETDKSLYLYSFGIDICELNGLAAYGHANNGNVYFFKMTDGSFVENFDAGGAIRDLAFDAAGNMVTVDNAAEWARFWSPGGYTVATTTFDGSQTTFQVTRPPAQVSVTASQATVPEAGPAVNFIISRVGSVAADLTVYYTLSGTADNGVDYTTLSGSAVIPANANSVNVALAPIDDAVAELSETVILTVMANSNYSVALPTSATISILDNETPEISFAAAPPRKLLESYAPSRVTHQVVRKGLLTPELTVNLSYSGTATRGVDYNAPAAVTVPAGAATANLVLTPINDQDYEGDETATANIAGGTGYTIGTPSSIDATVVDDDPPPGTVLFSDNFDTDSSALWEVNLYDPSDASVNFAWDYSTVGIPAAPAGGGTKGLRMRCGNTQLILNGLSVSPKNKSFTGDYRLKFDMWINYNGPMYDGGPGSTQNFDAGVGTSGQIPVWFWAPSPDDSVWFTVAGDGASGFTVGDYNAMIGATLLNDDSGVYAAGTGAPNSGIRDASNAYYALWGGQAAPAAQLAMYPNQTGNANIGNAGMAWHTVVITKEGDVVTWVMDGITIATVTNTALPFGPNVFVGYQDLWASGSLSDVPEMSFGLVDNLKVMTLAAPADIVITGIQLINGQADVQIDFTAGAGDAPADFTLQATANIASAPADVAANITSTGPGQFKAVRAVAGTAQFYRLRRN